MKDPRDESVRVCVARQKNISFHEVKGIGTLGCHEGDEVEADGTCHQTNGGHRQGEASEWNACGLDCDQFRIAG